ncbi:hypothetical protein D9M68_883870 [compost metagenome]
MSCIRKRFFDLGLELGVARRHHDFCSEQRARRRSGDSMHQVGPPQDFGTGMRLVDEAAKLGAELRVESDESFHHLMRFGVRQHDSHFLTPVIDLCIVASRRKIIAYSFPHVRRCSP